MNIADLQIGYVPLSKSFQAPGDRRRFIFYAQKNNLNFEIAEPTKKYDLVVLTQGADLSVWPYYERDGTKVIYDFIDSYLAASKNEIRGNLRGLAKYISGAHQNLVINHRSSIEAMCRRADAVICSTEEQARDISRFSMNVHQILDIQSTLNANIKTDYQSGDVFNIVWEGLGTNSYQVRTLKGVFAELQKKYKIALHLVTDVKYKKFLGKYWDIHALDVVSGLADQVFVYDWNELTCSGIITSCDLAVIPIDMSNPIAIGKPENKLLLFWRMGMPVITSATPVYKRVMNESNVRMACQTEQEWYDNIEAMILSGSLRKRTGVAGNEFVQGRYSEARTLAEWERVINSCFN